MPGGGRYPIIVIVAVLLALRIIYDLIRARRTRNK